jgi:hypothetical protein
MVLYIPSGIFHLARVLYVRSETFGPTLVDNYTVNLISSSKMELITNRLFGKHLEESNRSSLTMIRKAPSV